MKAALPSLRGFTANESALTAGCVSGLLCAVVVLAFHLRDRHLNRKWLKDHPELLLLPKEDPGYEAEETDDEEQIVEHSKLLLDVQRSLSNLNVYSPARRFSTIVQEARRRPPAPPLTEKEMDTGRGSL